MNLWFSGLGVFKTNMTKALVSHGNLVTFRWSLSLNINVRGCRLNNVSFMFKIEDTVCTAQIFHYI